MKLLLTLSLVVVVLAAYTYAGELDEFEQKHKEVVELIKKAKDDFSNDYVQNFCSLLEGGVEKLYNKTNEMLKTEHDATKRAEIINYAVAAFKRLILFINEVRESYK